MTAPVAPEWRRPPRRASLAAGEVAVWRLNLERPRPLETVVAVYLGVEVDEVTLARSASGKPELPGTGLHASLAHAGEATLVAVAAAGPVGVDVEPERAGVERWALVAHVLSERERRGLELLPYGARSRAVLEAWVRKEAILKASGHGLSVEPRLVEVGPGPVVASVPPALGRQEEWSLADLSLDAHVAAVALRGPLACVSCFDARATVGSHTVSA